MLHARGDHPHDPVIWRCLAAGQLHATYAN